VEKTSNKKREIKKGEKDVQKIFKILKVKRAEAEIGSPLSQPMPEKELH